MEAKKSTDIGMKRGRLLANMPPARQLDLIADGLPILMQSAEELLTACSALAEHERAGTILRGHALEEIAKILILLDVVRCPPKLRGQRIGPMMGWFYDHLARLIYIDAQHWKPSDVVELQSYVDQNRMSHYVEGAVGEYIMPNSSTWSRESLLYADIVAYEDGEPAWSVPYAYSALRHWDDPRSWKVCQALRDMGAFTREGLDVVSAVWSKTDFRGHQHSSDTEALTYDMLLGLEKAKLITERAHENQLSLLYGGWQLPMYWIDFRRIEVPLDKLREQQGAILGAEAGW